MITHIIQFWERFEINKVQLLESSTSSEKYDKAFTDIEKPIKKIHKDLNLIIEYRPLLKPKLYFITRGRLSLKILVSEILAFAPVNGKWEFSNGIPPWEGTLNELCLRYKFFGWDVDIYEIYFDVTKFHRSSKRMNLVLFVEKNRKLPRYLINENAKTLLIFYLGDNMYYKNIAHIKIVLKKYTTFNFAPISQLKKVLDVALT